MQNISIKVDRNVATMKIVGTNERFFLGEVSTTWLDGYMAGLKALGAIVVLEYTTD